MSPSSTHPHRLFLTGATGFVGKVVLAELLRQRDALGIAHVYVLIREKRGKTPQERFATDIAGAGVFRDLPPNWEQHVTAVAGELTSPMGGVAPDDLAAMQPHLTHIIHCAASLVFDQPIGEAAAANITSALNVLDIAKGCPSLKRMVDVSTAYVTPPRKGPMPEALVDLPFSPEAVYDEILAGGGDAADLKRRTGHANTYSLTKCIAEHLLVARCGAVPLSIVRPSIISATLHHPFPGWIDSADAMAAFALMVGTGHLRAVIGDADTPLDVVPCDVVTDCLLDELSYEGDWRIRYAVAGPERNTTVGQVIHGSAAYFRAHPVDRMPVVGYLGPQGLRFAWENWRHHTAPAMAAIALLTLTGRGKQAKKVRRGLNWVYYLNEAFPTFTQNGFEFVAAQPAAMPGFDPATYMALVSEGLYRHRLKRDPDGGAIAQNAGGTLEATVAAAAIAERTA